MAAPLHMPKLDSSMGAIEIGVLVSTLFYGMAVVQSYTYFASSAPDRTWLKSFVGVIIGLETAHTICVWVYLYRLTITNFGNPLAILEIPWYFSLSLGLQGTVSTLVQMFYTYRVYKISSKLWVALPALFGELFRLGLSLAGAGLSWKIGNLPAYRASYNYLVYLIFLIATTADVWNTAALCFYLQSQRKSFANTMSIINNIIIWAIETGVITTATALVGFICWSTMPNNTIWACIVVIYAKLFSNSLLISLNTRASFRDRTNLKTASINAAFSGIQITRNYDVEINMNASESRTMIGANDVSMEKIDSDFKHLHGKGAAV